MQHPLLQSTLIHPKRLLGIAVATLLGLLAGGILSESPALMINGSRPSIPRRSATVPANIHAGSNTVEAALPLENSDNIWGSNELMQEVEFRLLTGDTQCSNWLRTHAQHPDCGEAFRAAMRMWIADGSEQAALRWAASLPASIGRSHALQLAAEELPLTYLHQASQVLSHLAEDLSLSKARSLLAQRLSQAMPQ
jgi:hypothetical protein